MQSTLSNLSLAIGHAADGSLSAKQPAHPQTVAGYRKDGDRSAMIPDISTRISVEPDRPRYATIGFVARAALLQDGQQNDDTGHFRPI